MQRKNAYSRHKSSTGGNHTDRRSCRDGRYRKRGFFSEYVRPRYYTELKGRIKKLTGITKNDLKNAHDLTVVLKSFRKWLEKFGKDVIIVTWGPDDIPSL